MVVDASCLSTSISPLCCLRIFCNCSFNADIILLCSTFAFSSSLTTLLWDSSARCCCSCKPSFCFDCCVILLFICLIVSSCKFFNSAIFCSFVLFASSMYFFTASSWASCNSFIFCEWDSNKSSTSFRISSTVAACVWTILVFSIVVAFVLLSSSIAKSSFNVSIAASCFLPSSASRLSCREFDSRSFSSSSLKKFNSSFSASFFDSSSLSFSLFALCNTFMSASSVVFAPVAARSPSCNWVIFSFKSFFSDSCWV